MVGLPLTTNVPVTPAAALANERPTRSRFTSTRSPCFIAKLRAVAALCAMMRIRQDTAIGTTWTASEKLTPLGSPTGGKPPCTAPTSSTPWLAALSAADSAIVTITAMSAPGTFWANRLKPRMIARVRTANARVHGLVLPRLVMKCHCCWNQLPVPFGMPNMLGSCPVSTCTPTPVRKPMSTDDDRKSPMKPRRSRRESSRRTATTSAVSEHQATHSLEYGVRPATPSPARPAARIAAVAESAPTTSNLLEPMSANMRVGKMTV